MTPPLAWPRALLLASCAGACLALSGPPLSQHALAALPAFLFSPLLLALSRDRSPRRAALLGLVAGLGFGAYSLRFTLDVLARFADLGVLASLPVWLLLATLQAAPLALALGLARLADTPVSSRLWLTLPLALAGCFAMVPMLFPWHLAHFTLPWLGWAQQAELGGLPLLDLTTSLVGCLALEALRARARGKAAASLLLLGVAALCGHWRLAQVEAWRASAPALRVGLVQPDIGVAALRAGLSPAARLETLEALSDQADALGAQLTLWPEAAYPLTLSRDALLARDPDTLAGLAARRRRQAGRAPRVLGAMSAGAPCQRWNTLVVVDAAGAPQTHVDKRELFPFAEYIPFWAWSSALQRRFECPGERVGHGDGVAHVAGARVGLLNCYEDVNPERARVATRAGAQLLLNFSNDAWFGRSVQPELHRIVARFRAIETRRDLVRAVNTGASGLVTATGAEARVLPRHRAMAAVVEARLLSARTLSAQVGEWVPPLALAGLLALLGWRLLLARRERARQSRGRA